MKRHITKLKKALALVQTGNHAMASRLLGRILDEIPDPPKWTSPEHPPEDMGAWHWVWLAHMVLTETTDLELVSPAAALQTAIDLLEGLSPVG